MVDMSLRQRVLSFVELQDGPVGADEVVASFGQEGGEPPSRQHVLWTLCDCVRRNELVRVSRGLYAIRSRQASAPAEDDDLVDVRALEAPASDERVMEAKRALAVLIARKRQDLEAIRDERDRYEEIIRELERRLERSKPQEKVLEAELDRLERLNDNAQEIFGAVAEAIDHEREMEVVG
jgi:DNA repair exonuclease SbcCD ATPase subunit